MLSEHRARSLTKQHDSSADPDVHQNTFSFPQAAQSLAKQHDPLPADVRAALGLDGQSGATGTTTSPADARSLLNEKIAEAAEALDGVLLKCKRRQALVPARLEVLGARLLEAEERVGAKGDKHWFRRGWRYCAPGFWRRRNG